MRHKDRWLFWRGGLRIEGKARHLPVKLSGKDKPGQGVHGEQTGIKGKA